MGFKLQRGISKFGIESFTAIGMKLNVVSSNCLKNTMKKACSHFVDDKGPNSLAAMERSGIVVRCSTLLCAFIA